MRESRFVRIAKLAYHIAQQTLPTYSHPKSRHDYTFPQRVACVMLKIYLNYTYRDLEEWLLATDQVRQALQLTRVPDHTTLYRTFAKLSQAQWQQLNDALLQHLQVNEVTVAVDTTGFRTDTASAYYQSRCGRKRRSWHKGGFVVGTASQLIVGMRVGRGPGSDAPWLAPLRAQARRYVVRRGRSARFWLLADAGFDGRDVEWTDVVPPIRRGGRLRAWSRVLRAEIVERVKASGLYGQRWKVETVISVIKRKFGDGVRSRRLRLARCEVLAKGVVYNLHRSFCVVVDVWCVWWALRGGCRRSDWVSSQQSKLGELWRGWVCLVRRLQFLRERVLKGITCKSRCALQYIIVDSDCGATRVYTDSHQTPLRA
jgi:hypothetical protein